MNKLMVTLVSFPGKNDHRITITRLPKRVGGGWKAPRCHVLRYANRVEALNGYFRVAGKLAEMNRLHKGSAIEN